MRKTIASIAIAASSLLVLPFAFERQAQCGSTRLFGTQTTSPSNIAGAKAAKFQYCTTLDRASAMYRG